MFVRYIIAVKNNHLKISNFGMIILGPRSAYQFDQSNQESNACSKATLGDMIPFNFALAKWGLIL
jgi:hypothetical protein